MFNHKLGVTSALLYALLITATASIHSDEKDANVLLILPLPFPHLLLVFFVVFLSFRRLTTRISLVIGTSFFNFTVHYTRNTVPVKYCTPTYLYHSCTAPKYVAKLRSKCGGRL